MLSGAHPSQSSYPLIPLPRMLVLLAKRNTLMLYSYLYRVFLLLLLRTSARPNYQNLGLRFWDRFIFIHLTICSVQAYFVITDNDARQNAFSVFLIKDD